VRVVCRVGWQLQMEDCITLWDIQAPSSHIAHNQYTQLACKGRRAGTSSSPG